MAQANRRLPSRHVAVGSEVSFSSCHRTLSGLATGSQHQAVASVLPSSARKSVFQLERTKGQDNVVQVITASVSLLPSSALYACVSSACGSVIPRFIKSYPGRVSLVEFSDGRTCNSTLVHFPDALKSLYGEWSAHASRELIGSALELRCRYRPTLPGTTCDKTFKSLQGCT